VAVNLAVAQFRHGLKRVHEVQQALADSGLSPSRLQLEVTELPLISNSDQALTVLQALHERGVSPAGDDFGSGCSGLACRWRLPFDKVKTDGSFTSHLRADENVNVIVRSIELLAHSPGHALGHALGIRVKAEGVETDDPMAALRAHGCDELQGFLLARPGPTPDHRSTAAADTDDRHGRSAWPAGRPGRPGRSDTCGLTSGRQSRTAAR
jgi:EAL domain-containing protein (putative c-di-GMP-specific phosphodiesterase class I)